MNTQPIRSGLDLMPPPPTLGQGVPVREWMRTIAAELDAEWDPEAWPCYDYEVTMPPVHIDYPVTTRSVRVRRVFDDHAQRSGAEGR